MADTDEDKFRRTDEERKRRETELYALLWLLWDESRIHGQSAIRLGHDPGLAMQQVITGNPSLDLPGAVPPIRELLASADIAGQRRAIRLTGVPTSQVETPDAEDIEPEYDDAASEVANQLATRAKDTAEQYQQAAPGLSIAQRVKTLRDMMKEAWGPNGGELKNTASTPIIEAHSDGMWKGYAVQGNVVAFRHVSILDDRTTIQCQERSGLTLPAEDPYWTNGGWPPIHANCRSIVIPLMEAPARYSTGYPESPPSPGYGMPPYGAMLLDQ